jgi:inner membrane protein
VAWTAAPRGVSSGVPASRALWQVPAICAALAVAPDLDMFVTTHRASWHSIAAAGVVAAAAWLLARTNRAGGRLALASGLAWGSHVLLDWLGRDLAPPSGVMALWPFSRDYFVSGLDVFAEVSRRYWLPAEFVWGNLAALARELLILGPIAGIAYWRRATSG